MERCPDELAGRVASALADRFGVPPDALKARRLYVGGQDRVHLGPEDPVDGDLLSALQPDTGGLPAARPQATVKPTTDLLQLVGRHATRNVVLLGRDAARRYVAGEDLEAGTWEPVEGTTTGWVVVRYVDDATGGAFDLGCGLLREDRLENVLPKGRRVELAHL